MARDLWKACDPSAPDSRELLSRLAQKTVECLQGRRLLHFSGTLFQVLNHFTAHFSLYTCLKCPCCNLWLLSHVVLQCTSEEGLASSSPYPTPCLPCNSPLVSGRHQSHSPLSSLLSRLSKHSSPWIGCVPVLEHLSSSLLVSV